MRRIAVLLFALGLAAPLYAQRLNLDIPGLADRASETTDVTLDGVMLKFAAKFLSDSDPDERNARDLVRSLQGIYVRSYEFDREGEYDRSAVARVRSQLGPTWKPIVTVRSRMKENTDIYVDMRDEKVVGVLILSAEPRELTIVNIVGPIDLDKLASLEGEFGIPRITRGEDRQRGKRRD
jgi:hypothetical protein